MQTRLGRRVRDLGQPPDQKPSAALHRGSTRRPYSSQRVRVVRDGISPREVTEIAPPHVKRVLSDSWRYIVNRDCELSQLAPDQMVEPYTDSVS